jgi:Zn-dependent M16 (insulinase) family peptidase
MEQELLPNTPYAFVSGGDPLCIPHLSYGNLKEFHSKFYNYSQSKIVSYGNIDLKENLEYFSKVFSTLHPAEVKEKPFILEKWISPKRITTWGPTHQSD